MLIPLGTDRGVRRPGVVTPALVLVTVASFMVLAVLERTDASLHARIVDAMAVVGGPGFRWWQPWTCTLVHAGFVHLAGNMLFLWVFGQAVEDRYGRLGFLGLYLAGAYAAGGLHAAFERVWVAPAEVSREVIEGVLSRGGGGAVFTAMSDGLWVYVPAVGASGAIAAVTGAFLVLFPRTVIRCFWIFTLGVVLVPAWWFIGLAIAWNLLAHGLGVRGDVAYLAHLGGYALGFALSMALLWLRVFQREPYDLFTTVRQAHRRRQFRAVAGEGRPQRPPPARPSVQSKISDEVSRRRAEVSTLMGEGRTGEAAERYLSLAAEFAHVPGAATMSRRTQYDLAAHFVVQGRQAEAAAAYERFLAAYADDREAGAIKVMLARLLRGLGREGEARGMLEAVAVGGDEDGARLAREELAALGVGDATAG